MGDVKPIPDGYHVLTPHLVLKDAARAIDWYEKAIGAEERFRMPGPDGKGVLHAELQIGDSILMLCDEFPGSPMKSAESLGGTCVCLNLYTEDADTLFKRAVDAGASSVMPPMNAFWGDRYGKFKDPFGNEWAVMTHIEDVPPEEMPKRAEEAFRGGQCE